MRIDYAMTSICLNPKLQGKNGQNSNVFKNTDSLVAKVEPKLKKKIEGTAKATSRLSGAGDMLT